jgi:hypothetical protein
MRILRSIVAPLATLVAFCDSKMTGCGGIRSQLICDEPVWDKAIFLQQLAHQFKRRPLVPPGRDQHIEDLALGVDGAPKVDHPAIDFQIDFVQTPSRMGFGSAFCEGPLRPSARNGSPAPDGLIGDHDPAFRQQIFDVAEARREPNIKPDRVLDGFGRKAIASIADFDHRGWYGYRSVTASPPPT